MVDRLGESFHPVVDAVDFWLFSISWYGFCENRVESTKFEVLVTLCEMVLRVKSRDKLFGSGDASAC